MYLSFQRQKSLALSLFCVLFSLATFAQLSSIKGSVKDTTEKKVLSLASVNVLRAKDSVLVKTVRTSNNGEFNIASLPVGNYIIMVSYPQYADFTDKITVGAAPTVLNIAIDTKAHILKEVIVKNTVSAIRVKGDTTEYKADSF
jgi:hypothetical protein